MKTIRTRVCPKARLFREESGFTLPEMLVTMMIMLVVLFALYSIFDMSIRVFSFGNNKVEAAENARLGVEKIQREMRAAFPVDVNVTDVPKRLFFNANGTTADPPEQMPSSTQVTFGNETNTVGTSAGKIDCPSSTTCEYITYKLTAKESNTACTASPCTLRRVNAASSSATAGDAVVENVIPGGLTFAFYKSDGTAATNQGEIERVQVRLDIAVDQGSQNKGTQRLSTDIDLRNRVAQ